MILAIGLGMLAAVAGAIVARPEAEMRMAARPVLEVPADATWGSPLDRLSQPPGAFLTAALERRVSGMVLLCAAAGGIAVISLGLHSLERIQARWGELAIRRALGAPARSLTRLLATDLLGTAAAGAAIGAAGSAVLAAGLLASRPEIFRQGDGAAGAALASGLAAGGAALLLMLLVAVLLGALAGRGDSAGVILHGDRVSAGRGFVWAQMTLAALQQAGLLVVGFGFVLTLRDTAVGRAPARLPGPPDARVMSAPAVPATGAAASADAWVGMGRRLAVSSICGDCFIGPMFVPMSGATVRAAVAAPGSFAAMRLPVIAGREFTAADSAAADPVVILSDVAAWKLFPGASPIGRTVRAGPGVSFTVVGVVRGFAPEGLGTEGGRLQMLWVPAAQAPGAPLELTAADATGGVPLSQRADFYAAPLRWFAMLQAILAAAVLVTASWAVGSAMLGLVRLRRREIAIRLALGAPPRAMVAWLGAAALRVSLAGIFLGMPFATLLMAARGSLSPTADLALLVAMAGGMALLALGCALWPGWRAGGTDPVEAFGR